MRHFLSITVLLAVFFWAGPGSVRHAFARSVSVVADNEIKKFSKEETQAEAQAERRYNNFMKTYHKIWTIYGFYHEDFNGTPGNIRYSRIAKNYQIYEKHRERLLDICDKLRGPADLDAQAKAEGFADRKQQLEDAVLNLNPDINYMRIKLAELKKELAEIGNRTQTAKADMNKACTAKTRAQSKPFVENSIKAASQAVSLYKSTQWIPRRYDEKRQKYEALQSELESLESFAREHREVYNYMIESEDAMLKDLQSYSATHYLCNKRQRFDELVAELDKQHSELNRVLYPYKNHGWAQTMKDEAHAAGVRVGTISKEIASINDDDLWKIGATFRDRRKIVAIPASFSDIIGVQKNLETFYGLENSFQEVYKASKTSAIAARDDAKKAMACAKKLPDEMPHSNMDQGCPSNWNNCGNICCPPDVPCWDYGAIKQAVKAGRCR